MLLFAKQKWLLLLLLLLVMIDVVVGVGHYLLLLLMLFVVVVVVVVVCCCLLLMTMMMLLLVLFGWAPAVDGPIVAKCLFIILVAAKRMNESLAATPIRFATTAATTAAI